MPVRTGAVAERTSHRLIARNMAWNLFGQLAPLLIALVAIPVLNNRLGTERLGILMISWLVIGYFNVFDLGIGRALTKFVAESLSTGQRTDIAPLVWTSLAMMLGLGAMGSIVLISISPLLVTRVLNVSPNLQQETLWSFYILAAFIPVVMLTNGFRGVLEAYERFDLVSMVRVSMGLFNYLAPIVVALWRPSLLAVILSLVVGRLIALWAHLILCRQVMSDLQTRISFDRSAVRSLLALGAWISLDGIVYPLMVLFDRFLIGSLVSLSAIAYYSASFDFLTKVFIIPSAISGVLFPAFSAGWKHDRDAVSELFSQGVRYVFLAVYPIILCMTTLAPEILSIWLGSDFAQNGTQVFQIVAIGVAITSLAYIPLALLQGSNRAGVAGKLHLVELPIYAVLTWRLTSQLGIQGAALSWLVRGAFDTILLYMFTTPVRSSWAPRCRTALPAGLALVGLTLPVALTASSLSVKLLYLLLAGPTFLVAGWFWVLTADERGRVAATVAAIN